MPWQPGSLATELKTNLEKAYQVCMEEGNPDFVNQISTLPISAAGVKWNTHSLRRGGTKLARDLIMAKISDATFEDVDRQGRWHTDATRKDKQVSYAAMRSAAERIAVTRHF